MYTCLKYIAALLLFFVLNVHISGCKISLDDAIGLAQQQSYEAMVARLSFMSQYWSYRSFRAELLPAVNLSGGLLQYNRSMEIGRAHV